MTDRKPFDVTGQVSTPEAILFGRTPVRPSYSQATDIR